MVIVASAVIPVNISKDYITIINKEINKCGCVSANALAIQTRTPKEEILNVLDTMAKKGEIICNSNNELCCLDKQKLIEFSNKLKRLTGE